MTWTTTPIDLRRLWRMGEEVALFDLRDEGPYALAHPFFAVSLPLAQIESRVLQLVPRRGAPIVVYDDGEGLTSRGVARLQTLGYQDVRVLKGGLQGYRAHGEVFRDVNVPSKAFGELVDAIRHTPSLAPHELKALIEANENIIVLDARRFEEYRAMSIPRGISVPGAELVLRAPDLAASPETLVVVNCAGRTRSIIGAQSLVNAGVPNRVVALRNGTIGWTLAGLALDEGAERRAAETSAAGREKARAAAALWAAKVGVRTIDGATLARWRDEHNRRTLHLLDVRAPEEHAAGHPPGFVSAPGGQLVQATDEWVAVRGARLALYDDDGVRARMTASWLVQMGWEAVVVAPDALKGSVEGFGPAPRPPPPDIGDAAIEAADLARLDDATVVDLALSPVYQRGHIPGAWFVAGARLSEDLARVPGEGPIVLTSADGALARDNFGEAQAATQRRLFALNGGTKAWAAAGFPLADDAHLWASPPEDVYKRPYEGADNAHDAMQAYIDWELQLVAQLANDGVSRFHVIR